MTFKSITHVLFLTLGYLHFMHAQCYQSGELIHSKTYISNFSITSTSPQQVKIIIQLRHVTPFSSGCLKTADIGNSIIISCSINIKNNLKNNKHIDYYILKHIRQCVSLHHFLHGMFLFSLCICFLLFSQLLNNLN